MKPPNLDAPETFDVKEFVKANPFWTAVFALVILSIVGNGLIGNSEAEAPMPTTATVDKTPDPVDTDTFVIPQLFRNIEQWTPTETDCTNLQSWFNGASNAHGNQSDVGAMRWLSGLMGDIDNRMSQVGCYD